MIVWSGALINLQLKKKKILCEIEFYGQTEEEGKRFVYATIFLHCHVLCPQPFIVQIYSQERGTHHKVYGFKDNANRLSTEKRDMPYSNWTLKLTSNGTMEGLSLMRLTVRTC